MTGLGSTRRDADGVQLTPSVGLLATPGHRAQDITTLVGTPDDVATLVLGLATLVVPGHGAPFRPSSDTVR